MIRSTAGAGRTKRVTLDGITKVKNDVMLEAFVDAESHEAAARAFATHPHFQILNPRSRSWTCGQKGAVTAADGVNLGRVPCG